MTIEKSAIQHLQDSANMLELDGLLQQQKTAVPAMMVPNGFSIESLESKMKFRTFFKFYFSTQSVSDFVEYCKGFDNEGATCFVDGQKMSAKAIFDIGSTEEPLHQLNKAVLSLDETQAFKTLQAFNQVDLDQRRVIDFLEDSEPYLTVISRKDKTLSVGTAVNNVRSLSVEKITQLKSEIRDFSNEASAMEREEMKGASDYPATFMFTCRPYTALQPREFKVRISYLTGSEKLGLRFRIVALEDHVEDMKQEFKKLLVDEFETFEMKTFIGKAE